MNAPMVAIEPVVNWPRSARAGQRYLVTVDLMLAEPIEWPYDREEFIVGCVLEGSDAFTIEALGSTNMVLHRFGGTYGPVRYAMQAQENPAADGSDTLRLTLVTEGGLPFAPIELPVLPDGTDTDVIAVSRARWTTTTQPRPGPARTAAQQPNTAGSVRPARLAARRIALLIGASGDNLRGPENDVAAMAQALIPYGFSTVQAVGADATRAGILAAFEKIIAEANPDDAVFFYYSGHGGAYTVALPPAVDQAGDQSRLRVPFLMPNNFAETEGFGGITSIEIAALLARLTDKTRNVVAAYDCDNGCAPSTVLAAPGTADRTNGPTNPVLASHVDKLERHLGTLQTSGVRVPGSGTLDVVQLHACGTDGNAYERPTADGRHMGAFTAALTRALEDAATLHVTWTTLIDHVRRLIRAEGTDQRPTVTGPAQRLLFSLDQAEQDSSLPIVGDGANRARILGAALLGVRVGDEFAVMPAGATGPDDHAKICDAVVDELVATEARAYVTSGSPDPTIPIGARAHRIKAVAPLLPVKLPPPNPDLDELFAAISASPLLRPAENDEPYEYTVSIGAEGDVVIQDRIGPLSDPMPATVTRTIVTGLERLARAAALRGLAEDSWILEDPWTLHGPVTVEWGTVVDGRPVPMRRTGATVRAGQSIYMRIRNGSTERVYVSLIDIGVAAAVTLLSAPRSGVQIDPGQEYFFGRSVEGEVRGAQVLWPRNLDPSHARVETIMVLVTSEPVDVGVLEQSGIRGVPRGSRSPLEQLLAQVVTGSPRYTLQAGETAVRYAIRSIDFELVPTKGSGRVRILMVAAQPAATTNLRLDDEAREIAQELRRSRHRDAFELSFRRWVRPHELLRSLNEIHPNVVHFIGHGGSGSADRILLSSSDGNEQPVDLTELFRVIGRDIQVVVLNGCYSAAQAQAISSHVDYVVGTPASVSDATAIAFSAAFYSALGYGRTITEAFEQAAATLMMNDLAGREIPQLMARSGADPHLTTGQ